MRELTVSEIKYIRKLRNILHNTPKNMAIRQSNETGDILIYDGKTGKQIDYGKSISGFSECDPTEILDDWKD